MWRSSALRSPGRRPPVPSDARRRERILAGWREFRREIDRSRRHERPFAMISIPIDPDVEDAQVLPPLVANTVRSVDVVWEDGANIYVVMPETRREAAIQAMARIRSRLTSLGSRQFRIAVFPEDASTAGALLDVLEAGSGEVAAASGSAPIDR